MDYLPKRIVDAGYISWLYGANPEGVNAWNMAKFEFLRDLMVLDGNPRSYRTEYWPDYKAHRRMRKDPEIEAQKERVRKFREALYNDWTLTTIMIDGLEADDIVAVLSLYALAEEIHVVGVDKDYLQLPPYRLKMTSIGGEVANIGNFRKQLPKTVRMEIKEPIDVLFTLALLGDKADNIPRLVPPYHLHEFLIIMEARNLSQRICRAQDFYGDDFGRNIYLAVLPGPWVYDPVPREDEVLEMVANGNYYEQELSVPIKARVLGTYYSHYPFETEELSWDGIKEKKTD